MLRRDRRTYAVERRHKDTLHLALLPPPLRIADVYRGVEQRKDVVVNAVLLAEVEVEAVAIDLRLGVVHQMLRDEDHQDVLGRTAAGEVGVCLGVVREKQLAYKREDDLFEAIITRKRRKGQMQ